MMQDVKIPIYTFKYDMIKDEVVDVHAGEYLKQLNIGGNNQFVDLTDEEIETLGENEYKFRKGLGYKGEVYRLKFKEIAKKDDNGKVLTAVFYTFDKVKGRFQQSDNTVELEVKYINPLVLSPHLEVEKFSWESNPLYLIFPYKKNSKVPISLKELKNETPLLHEYIVSNRSLLRKQSSYNKRIQNTAYWGVIRVGLYTFAKNFIIIRDNTRLSPHVVSSIKTHWGENKMPLFDGHISYISVRPDGKQITKKEANYIKQKIKTAEKTLLKIYDSRSISSRLPIRLALYKE